MTQALYAHMNNKTIKKNKNKLASQKKKKLIRGHSGGVAAAYVPKCLPHNLSHTLATGGSGRRAQERGIPSPT
jgi:hypothetical protein